MKVIFNNSGNGAGYYLLSLSVNERKEVAKSKLLEKTHRDLRSLAGHRAPGEPLRIPEGTIYEGLLRLAAHCCSRPSKPTISVQHWWGLLSVLRLVIVGKELSEKRAYQLMDQLYSLVTTRSLRPPNEEELRILKVSRRLEMPAGVVSKTTVILTVPESSQITAQLFGSNSDNITNLGGIFVPVIGVHFYIQKTPGIPKQAVLHSGDPMVNIDELASTNGKPGHHEKDYALPGLK